MMNDLRYEIADVCPQYPEILNSFVGEIGPLSLKQVQELLIELANVPPSECVKVLDLLLWFSFLGVAVDSDNRRYSYDVFYNIEKLKAGSRDKRADNEVYHIHPAFRKALMQ